MGMANEDNRVDTKPNNFTDQCSKNTPLPTSTSIETDKVQSVRNSENQVLLGSRSVDTDKIEAAPKNDTWSEDKVRLLIVICVFSLFAIYVIVGLVMFIVTGNLTLLLSATVIAIPVHVNRVMKYYFYRPRQK